MLQPHQTLMEKKGRLINLRAMIKIIPGFIKRFLIKIHFLVRNSKENQIPFSVRVSKGVTIGKKCKIGTNVSLGPMVTLGNGVTIASGVFLERISIGDGSAVESGIKITGCGEGKIIVGKESYLGINNVLDWSDDITIGDFVHIAGPSTGIFSHTSAPMCLQSIPLHMKDKTNRPTAPVVIENNVYIGGNCTIYPGVTIGHHSVIAPNSAVNKDIEPYSMYGGVPARKIKDLK